MCTIGCQQKSLGKLLLVSNLIPDRTVAPKMDLLCILMDSSFWFDKLGLVHCIYLGVSGYNFL